MNRRQLFTILGSLLLAFFVAGTAVAQTSASKAPAKSADLIDLNSATRDQLMTLPGIGEALSQKIIDNRPYRAKNQLVQKKIIPQSNYDRISGMIIAKQPATSAKKTPH